LNELSEFDRDKEKSLTQIHSFI